MNIEILDLRIDQLALIENLWFKNANIHKTFSKYFNKPQEDGVFKKRLHSWIKVTNLKFTVAKDKENIIGYCISSADNNNGVIESLFILNKYRNIGLGTTIIKNHIQWFEAIKCRKISVTTVYENPTALHFYKSVGLYPKTILIEKEI